MHKIYLLLLLLSQVGCATTALQSHSIKHISSTSGVDDMKIGGITKNGDLSLCLIGKYKGEVNTIYQVTVPKEKFRPSIEWAKNNKRQPSLTPKTETYMEGCNINKNDLLVELENHHDSGPIIVGSDPNRPYVRYVKYQFETLSTLRDKESSWYVTNANDSSDSLLGHVKFQAVGDEYTYFKLRKSQLQYDDYTCTICLAAMPVTIVADILTSPFQLVYYGYLRVISGH